MTFQHETLKAVMITALVTAVLTAGAVAGFKMFGSGSADKAAPPVSGKDAPGHEGHGHDEDNPLWTCGMHPWIITEEAGLCPICNMELTPLANKGASGATSGEREVAYWKDPDNDMAVYRTPEEYTGKKKPVPVYEDQLINGVDIRIDPVIQQNMGIRTARVAIGPLSHTIRTYGNLTYDETRTMDFSLKFSGWIEVLHSDYTGRSIQKGDPLFAVYSPELFAAQEAYRHALETSQDINSRIRSSARQRLENFGIHETEIRAIETTGKISKHLVVRSPYSGVIIAKTVSQGAYAKAGERIFTISDLSRIWVKASIFEYETSRLETGLPAVLEFPYLPGRTFQGKVAYIYPYLNKKTRDVTARLEFANPDRALKPGMYANVSIQTAPDASGMVIDSEAVVRSGESNLVFVAKGRGRFLPRQVALGLPLANGKVQVVSGLAPGEIIVTSGQFLLDSESSLQETIQKMMAPDNPIEPDTGPETGADEFFNDMMPGAAPDTKPGGADDFFDDMTG